LTLRYAAALYGICVW